MKLLKITLLIAVLLAAAWFTPILLKNPGLIQIEFFGYQIQMTAIAAAITILLLFILLWLLLVLLKAPGIMLKNISAHRGRKKFAIGLLALSEGKWAKAEKLMLKSVKQNPAPELSYMAAARAAIMQNKQQTAEKYLDQAEQIVKNPLTVDLTRCELWVKTNRQQQAIPLLKQILKSYPNNPKAIQLLAQAQQSLGNWSELRTLIPKAEKLQIISPEQSKKLKQQATEAAFAQAENSQQLQQIWHSLNKKQQHRYQLQYCQNGIRVGAYQEITEQIEKSQKANFQEQLVQLWSELPHNLNHRLSVAEKWLKHHPNSAATMLCKAKLHLAKNQPEAAEPLLLQALKLNPSQELNQLLGRLYQQQQKPEQALLHYGLSTEKDNHLPLIETTD